MSDKEIKTNKPAYKYGLQISEPQKRLWVGEINNGIVVKTLYTDTWGGNCMAGTREKAIENAKLIAKALNTFDASVDAPYCHDLAQRIELLEMELEAAETKISYNEWLEGELVKARVKAEAYDRLMSGEPKHCPFCHGEIKPIDHPPFWMAINGSQIDVYVDGLGAMATTINYCPMCGRRLTLPDGWEER